MIHANRIVTVGEQESIIDRPIILYRGDREVEIEFTLVGNEFTFSEEGNVIKSVNASHGQLVLNTPSGEHMFSELAECHEGKVVFVVTKEMIDEFVEMGFYSFQIRLYDSAEMKSRVTIPPVMNGFDIRNPIAAEDEVNVVDQGLVDYARVFKDQSNEELHTFDWTGAYNKTEWVHHDVITENKMNKIEDALYSINATTKELGVDIPNTLDHVKKDADKYVKEHMAEVEADVEEFERNLNTDVQKFKIDTNAAMTTHKNEVSEVVDGFSSQLALKPNVVTIKMFIDNGEEHHTDAFKRAIEYATSTKIELFVEDGEYVIDDTIDINIPYEFRIYFSKGAVIKAKTNDFVFKLSSRWITMDNVSIVNYNSDFKQKYNGIYIANAICNLNNAHILNANKGVLFDTNAWCCNTSNLKILYTKYPIELGQNSGSCSIGIQHIIGSANYNELNEDGSIGIQLHGGTTTISGGQIDSCNYAIYNTSNENKILNTYIEHNNTVFKEDSHGEMYINAHITGSNYTPPKELSIITPIGYSKRSTYNNTDLFAIPYNDLLGYYIFDKVVDGEIIDYSGNGNNIALNNIDYEDTINMFGKSVRLKTSNNKSGRINLNTIDISKPLTFVVSFKTDKMVQNARILDVRPPNIDRRIYYHLGHADCINNYENGVTTKLNLVRELDYTSINSLYAFTIDFSNGEVRQQQTILPYTVKDNVNTEVYKTNGLNPIIFLQSFSTIEEWYDFNYLLIFNSDISREQLFEIQNNNSFIVTPKFLGTLK